MHVLRKWIIDRMIFTVADTALFFIAEGWSVITRGVLEKLGDSLVELLYLQALLRAYKL